MDSNAFGRYLGLQGRTGLRNPELTSLSFSPWVSWKHQEKTRSSLLPAQCRFNHPLAIPVPLLLPSG